MKKSLVHGLFGSVVVAVCVLCRPPSAQAETDEDFAKAKTLFEDARKLMTEGRYEAACPLLEQSLSLARGIGTRFNLADCEEHLEHYARAQQLYSDVADLAREAGQPERERVARERATALESKLSHLKFELETEPAEIELDGHLLPADAAMSPQAVLPGTHHVKVSAADKQAFTKEVDVPKPGMWIILAVPPLAPALPIADSSQADSSRNDARPEHPPTPKARNSEARAERPNVAASERAHSRFLPGSALVVGSVGLGAVTAGAIFGLRALSKNHDAKQVCPTSYGCSQDQISQHEQLIDDARTARTWSVVGFGVGAAALAGAATLFFTSGRASGRADSVRVTTGYDPNKGWNVTLLERF